MTAHVSKEQLGLMLPGTMSHFIQDEMEYREAPRPGLLAQAAAAVSGWLSRQDQADEVAGLSDAQLSDIGITHSDVKMVFDSGFIARREQDRMVAILQAGRGASI
jgi:uncharacterized protein YjiS (DUF1127 family)